MLWTLHTEYHLEPFAREADLEAAIREVRPALFGPSRIYLDAKRRIGAAGRTNIPDGYLIDLSSTKQPALYVVENELAKHDHLRHIAVQILQFSLAFETTPQVVISIVRNALDIDSQAQQRCEEYAQAHGFRNVDYLLEQMVYKGGFQALVIIDELPPELESVLIRSFKFGVELLTLTRYTNATGERIYQFEPFLADVVVPSAALSGDTRRNDDMRAIDPSDIDTIVVPAQEEGFRKTALGEHRWYEVRIHGSYIPRVKHLAVYRVSPISAITHVAPVQSIEPWQNSGKYVLNFAEPLKEIGPLKLVPGGRIRAPQNIRYTSYERLVSATNLDEAFLMSHAK